MAARHTNLLFGAPVNPYRTDALERLQWAKMHGAVLVKWIPPIMEIDPADPKLIPFYKKMAALNLPLLSHAGKEKSFSRAEAALGDPERLRLPLSLGVTVIAAHTAAGENYHGERGPDRLARLMREYPQSLHRHFRADADQPARLFEGSADQAGIFRAAAFMARIFRSSTHCWFRRGIRSGCRSPKEVPSVGPKTRGTGTF